MNCKYYFGDLVYVDFDNKKIIGTIEAHRIIDDTHILYNISNIKIFVPSTMIHILTEEQNMKYKDFLKKQSCHSKEEYFKEMQSVFE